MIVFQHRYGVGQFRAGHSKAKLLRGDINGEPDSQPYLSLNIPQSSNFSSYTSDDCSPHPLMYNKVQRGVGVAWHASVHYKGSSSVAHGLYTTLILALYVTSYLSFYLLTLYLPVGYPSFYVNISYCQQSYTSGRFIQERAWCCQCSKCVHLIRDLFFKCDCAWGERVTQATLDLNKIYIFPHDMMHVFTPHNSSDIIIITISLQVYFRLELKRLDYPLVSEQKVNY